MANSIGLKTQLKQNCEHEEVTKVGGAFFFQFKLAICLQVPGQAQKYPCTERALAPGYSC